MASGGTDLDWTEVRRRYRECSARGVGLPLLDRGPDGLHVSQSAAAAIGIVGAAFDPPTADEWRAAGAGRPRRRLEVVWCGHCERWCSTLDHEPCVPF